MSFQSRVPTITLLPLLFFLVPALSTATQPSSGGELRRSYSGATSAFHNSPRGACVPDSDGSGSWVYDLSDLECGEWGEKAVVGCGGVGTALGVEGDPQNGVEGWSDGKRIRFVCANDGVGSVSARYVESDGVVEWRHSAACPVHSSESCPRLALPMPTQSQWEYAEHEIMGLTHFNMATWAGNGDPGCNPSNWNKGVNSSNPATFAPTNLNVSNWVESYKAVGAKHAVLTAKHGCGFLLWNSNVTLPSTGQEYVFAVQRESVPSYGRNVAVEFYDTLKAAGLGRGYYYSMGNNYFLCRISNSKTNPPLPGQECVSDDDYNTIVRNHLQELWSQVSEPDGLFEIWFDHGTLQNSWLQMTLSKYQPSANGFNGQGVTPNVVRWVGTEDGTPAYPTWSTGDSGQGDPNSADWAPAGVDTTLQDGDVWFYQDGDGIRDLSTLIDVYHHSVGQNGVLELDFAIDQTGNVHPTHAAAYKALGDWATACYSTPLNHTSANASTLTLQLQAPSTVDRIMLMENQWAGGERVRAWTVETNVAGAWTSAFSGSAIGHKYIGVLATPVQNVQALRLNVTSAAAPPMIRSFAAFKPCPSS